MLKIQILLQRDHVNGKLLGLPKVEVVCQTVTCKFIKYSSRRDFTKISGRVTKKYGDSRFNHVVNRIHLNREKYILAETRKTRYLSREKEKR